MNGPFVVAQASTAEATAPKKPIRIVKVTKPSDGQAVTVDLGYQQQAKLDLSSVANEKMTLVHIGEKLIILFDNNATVTVEPFFDSMGVPRLNLTVEVTPGRELTSGQFAIPCSRSPRINRCCPRPAMARKIHLQAPISATRPLSRCSPRPASAARPGRASELGRQF